MELDECINFSLTRAQNSVFNYFKNKLSPLDVTPVQYAVLKCLWDNGDQLPTQISQAICLESSTVTGILSRMEKKDLIERVHSETDRRAVNIRIKPAGVALRPAIETAIKEANEEVMRGMGTGDMAQLWGWMDHIVANVEALVSAPDYATASSSG
ncbi:MarR family transcriptional regulator [Ruminococcaceae bacterium OttesenSCG-928-D13]|nr:MarR family transcriptional regulator [Ruminococcaceae bacterium OttesenSCG-928-D13]